MLSFLFGLVVLMSVLGPCVGLLIWAVEHSRKYGGWQAAFGFVFGLFFWVIATGVWFTLAVPCLMHCGNRSTSWTEVVATPVYALLALAITSWCVTRHA